MSRNVPPSRRQNEALGARPHAMRRNRGRVEPGYDEPRGESVTTTVEVSTSAVSPVVEDAIEAHEAETDPHTGYQKESEKSQASGYASLDASALVPVAELPVGTGAAEVAAGDHTHALDDLSDVNSPAPANGDVLTWDSTPGEWVPVAPASGSLALDDLTDVNAPTPADGEVLLWDSTPGEWVAGAAPAGTPAATVTDETTFGIAKAVGTATEYAREDHTHGTPANPVTAHEAAADPHTGYQRESEKGAASGYASLDGSTKVPVAQLPTGGAGQAHAGTAGAAGAGSTVSLYDHVHPAQVSLDSAGVSDYILRWKQAGDTQYRLEIEGDGGGNPQLAFGPGGVTAPDTTMYRVAAGALKVNGDFYVADAVFANHGNAVPVGDPIQGALGTTPGQDNDPIVAVVENATYGGVLQFGLGDASSSRDTNLYRGAADTLKTDDALQVGQSVTAATDITATTGDITATAGDVVAGGNVQAGGDVKVAGGDILMGTLGAEDARVARTAASDLTIDDNASTHAAVVRLQGQFWVRQSAATDVALLTGTGTNTSNMPYAMQADGKMNWGDGTNARDTNLYRSAANTLKTDDSLVVGTDLDVSGDAAIAGGDLLYGTAGSEDVRIGRTAARELTIDDNASHANPTTVQVHGEVGTFRTGATNSVFTASVDTDSTPYRFLIKADGTHEWGAGSAARDVNLYRSAANILKTDDSLDVSQTMTLHEALIAGDVITPAAIGAHTNSYLPTGGNTAMRWRISSSAAYNITGISSSVTQTDGRLLILQNVGTFTITLVHDATSTAANRFLCPNSANLALRPNGMVFLTYDTTSSRWRVMGA